MPSAKMAGLMVPPSCRLTVMFKSLHLHPAGYRHCQPDVPYCQCLSGRAGADHFLRAATGEDKAESIIRTDYKEFHIGGHNLAVSQITCLDSDRLMARKEEFLATMETIRKKNGLDIVLLMITDVLVEGSYLLYSEIRKPSGRPSTSPARKRTACSCPRS